MKIFLVIALGICALGWFLAYVGGLALLRYMEDKNYEMPTKEEADKYTKKVFKEIFKGKE